MAAVFRTTFWNGFSWIKIYKFRFIFHWIWFLGVPLTIFQHWFRRWIGAYQATIIWTNDGWRICVARPQWVKPDQPDITAGAHWHRNGNVFILMKLSSLAALEVVKVTTSSAASDENFVKMTTFLFQWKPREVDFNETRTYIKCYIFMEIEFKMSPVASRLPRVVFFPQCVNAEIAVVWDWPNVT